MELTTRQLTARQQPNIDVIKHQVTFTKCNLLILLYKCITSVCQPGMFLGEQDFPCRVKTNLYGMLLQAIITFHYYYHYPIIYQEVKLPGTF